MEMQQLYVLVAQNLAGVAATEIAHAYDQERRGKTISYYDGFGEAYYG